ncbi:transmembrane protein 177 [Latimeria chalumnae]|uniref:Transmembrane protein 177 n=1 Tax=Latimeria chalumnae TaxID=7897 RepID=H3ATK0_LATCH|nr:PREDICTED: transmembrane protein 177 [Latimeria chalumnae]|eukprot:XP_005990623.1 PREDICTED: transmembrane protein 177 [Latimeria chalumnae]
MGSLYARKLTAFFQKYRTGLLVVSCSGVFAGNLCYHTFPEQMYKKVYQAWFNGQPAELSEKLQRLFGNVVSDTGMGSPKNYRAFASFGFQPTSAGIPWLPNGAIVGIPANFNSTTGDPQGITNRVIMINGKELEWDSKLGASLQEALTLSSDAQKFAIAREVMCLQFGSPIVHAAVAPACLAGTCISAVAIKQLLGLYSGPIILRGLCNIAIVAVGLFGYFVAYDAASHWLDYRADRKAAAISRDYAKGGVEFYDKVLSRNRTFRSLMGKKGEKMYASNGNLFPTHWFRLKHAPYTLRKEVLVNILKEQES